MESRRGVPTGLRPDRGGPPVPDLPRGSPRPTPEAQRSRTPSKQRARPPTPAPLPRAGGGSSSSAKRRSCARHPTACTSWPGSSVRSAKPSSSCWTSGFGTGTRTVPPGSVLRGSISADGESPAWGADGSHRTLPGVHPAVQRRAHPPRRRRRRRYGAARTHSRPGRYRAMSRGLPEPRRGPSRQAVLQASGQAVRAAAKRGAVVVRGRPAAGRGVRPRRGRPPGSAPHPTGGVVGRGTRCRTG